VNEMRMDGIKEESGIFPDIPAGFSGRDQSVSGATGQEDRDCSGICGDRSTGRAACQERGPGPGMQGPEDLIRCSLGIHPGGIPDAA
jgi:hypothetical protein